MTRSRSSYSSLFVLTLFVSILLHSVLGAGDDPTLDINRNAPKSRGSRFALAFMNNQARTLANTQQQITLFITTEQESSRFTLETRWSGVNGERFIETSPGSGLWSRTEIARRGEFTFINLPAGANGDEDIAIQDNGDDNIADRQKGVIITSENESDELTIYVLSDELVSTDAYMAINCVEFSSARDYRYFIFSSDVSGGETFRSRFLFTPCEDNTTVSVQPSQVMTHPNWVESSVSNTIARVEVTYGRRFNRFDTVMLSHMNNLTGSIITSNKPLSVIAGHQCGAPTNDGTCDYLVEQLPPHPTYGDLFFMAPFAVRQSGELYRIGSVTAGAQVTINCQCASSSADGSNQVALVSSGDGVYTATVGVGQYVECRTPANAQTYCCVTSTQPITMAGYTLGSRIDSLHNIVNPPLPFNPIADPAMIYIPPAKSYLNNYSFSTAQNLSTEFQGFLSYILLSQIFDNSEADRQRFRINGETYIPDQYEAINCRVGGTNQVCAYGATKFMGQGNFDISYESTSTGAFWGFAYGYAREASFAYPLPFEMEPIGLAWIQAVDQVVVESLGIVDLEFSITRGDQSLRSRAYAVTQDLSAEAGSDYTTTGLRPGEGNSNLRWRRAAIFPNNRFIVSILVDSIPEPVEVVEVVVACDGNENCYLPRTRYTITIIDDEGACADLPAFPNGSISYDFRIFTEIGGRPYGTVATYECDNKRILVEPTRTCVNGEWTGREPSSCEIPPQRVEIMFSVAVFSFSESDGQGFVEIVADMAPSQSFDFVVTGSPNTQDFVITSAAGLPGQVTFPADQTSVRVSFNITNDEISVENLESYLATLSLTAGTIAAGVSLGALTQATVQIMDDDDVSVSVGQTTYNVQESDGSVTLSYVLNREAVRDVSFDVINVDGTAIGGGVDYSSAGYSLTIPARETNVSRSISITMDGIAGEENETFINRVSTINTANVGAGASDATVTIEDSDEARVMFGSSTYNFVESDGTATIQVIISVPVPASFEFSVTGDRSIQQSVQNSGGFISVTEVFPEGASSFDITFSLTDDNVTLEVVETLIASLRLTNPHPGIVLGSPYQAFINIQDDDVFVVGFDRDSFSVQENEQFAFLTITSTPAVRPFTLSVGTINGNGTATGGSDFEHKVLNTTISGGTRFTFIVTILDDSIVEGNETIVAFISSSDVSVDGPGLEESTVIIVDNDVVECPPLQPIKNGFVTYNKPGGLPKYSLGTLATYSCNKGFIFDRSTEIMKRTCTEDIGIIGVWNGLQPFCVSGCDAEVYQNYSWSNTALGSTALSPCPCVEILGVFAGKVSRQCSGSISKGGMWKDVIDVCETTNSGVSRELCNIALDLGLSSNKTTQASNQIANITSKPQNLTASQITLLTRIVEQVAEEAAANEEVRDGYLQTINNIQNVDADVIYESQLAMNSSTRILASVETFLDNLNTSTVSNSTSNQTVLSFETFAMTVQDLDPDSFQGQTFVVDLGPVDEEMNNTGVIDQDALVTFNDGNGDTSDNRSETGSPNKDAENSTASVHLNPSLFEDCLTTNGTLLTQRLSYSVFLSDVLFLPENRSTNQVGSIVVAARLACLQTNKTMLSVPVRTSFLIRMTDNVTNSSCALYRTQDRFGAWDTAGCREITSSNGRKDCECRQLGHFGILFDLNPTSLPENLSITLSIITYIGLGLSVICLLVFIFTIFISKELLVDKQNQILINMSISLICLYFTFLIGGFTVGVPPLCGVMSALLQYFFLVFFSWMAVEAVWLYIKLVVVMGSDSLTSKFMLKAGLPAWLFPLVIVAISTGVGYQYYSNPYYCRPTEWPFYFGFIFPFVIIYLLNWIVFVAIMVSICKHFANGNLSPLKDSSSRQQFRNFQKNLIIAMCLSVVLGLGWGLGLVSTSSGLVELSFIFQVIFSIFVGFQGVLIFFFYGLRSTDFRQTWTKLFNGCKSNTDNFVPFEKGITNTRDMFSPTAGVELLNVKTLPSKQHSPHNEEKELKEPKLNL